MRLPPPSIKPHGDLVTEAPKSSKMIQVVEQLRTVEIQKKKKKEKKKKSTETPIAVWRARYQSAAYKKLHVHSF